MKEIEEELELLKEGISKRFNTNEDKILSLIEKQSDFFKLMQQLQKTSTMINGVYDKMTQIVNKIESHERDLNKIASTLDEIEKHGVKNNNSKSSENIDYEKLVKLLIKTSKDVIKNEVQLQK